MELRAVIYNCYFDKDKIIAEDTRNYIKDWLYNNFKGTEYIEIGTLKI